jgi:DNA-binding transcriptional LysR family regulator
VGRSPETFDLLISCTAHELPGFERETLCSDTEVAVVRAGHPAQSRLTTRDGFLAASHIAVVGRGLRDDPFDDWLRQQGLVRRIALRVPSYVQALQVAARTDLVAFVPNGLAQSLAQPLSLSLNAPPVDPGAYDEYLFHPRRTKRDPASMWLREVTPAVRAGGEPSEDVLHPV